MLYQTFVFHYLQIMQIMQALLILTISGVTSAAITIVEPHAFGLIHPPEVSGLFAHDYDKDGDGNKTLIIVMIHVYPHNNHT